MLRDIVLVPGGGVHFLKLAQKKVMLGTDTAPHDDIKKFCDCGCAGVFNGPIALQLLAELFYRYSTPEMFQAFVSDNAKAIYGVNPPKKVVTLAREPFVIPEHYGSVSPMWHGKEIPWSVNSGRLIITIGGCNAERSLCP
jgi:dihydroorotase